MGTVKKISGGHSLERGIDEYVEKKNFYSSEITACDSIMDISHYAFVKLIECITPSINFNIK
jgi:hypothetical protein